MPGKQAKLKELDSQMTDSNFWNNPEAAKTVLEEAGLLRSWTEPFHRIKRSFEDLSDLLPDADPVKDKELYDELLVHLKRAEVDLEQLELKKMLSRPFDSKNCYLTINAGAGGTEACDWALMLSRMYERWASKRGWKVEVVDQLEGDVAGYKSITYKFTGPFCYGYAKAEKGVHRLVRISPFDSNAKRHTSFASVDVSPEIDEAIDVVIRPEDLRVDTYRASGAGGQHVNKTDSAVRITHIPTGLVVSCQAERSQLQNRETCMKMLRSRLYEKEVEAREESLAKEAGEKKEIAWGIRSYVFQPYQLVKDTRTGYEVGNIEAMMDGELLDDFIVSYLKQVG